MYFLHQIKHTSGNYEKGIVVKETFEAAKQSYHAYLGAYAYGQQPQTDFCNAMITNDLGAVLLNECWQAPVEQVQAE